MLDLDFEKKINFIIFKIHSARKKALAEPDMPKFKLDENGEPVEETNTVNSLINSKRFNPQTILISATLTNGIKEIARRLNVVDAIHVEEETSVSESSAASRKMKELEVEEMRNKKEEEIVLPAGLTHYYVIVPTKLRLVSLISFILGKFIVKKRF